MTSFNYDDESYRKKRFLINTCKILGMIFILLWALISCDADYTITKYTAPKYTGARINTGVTKTPFQAKNSITRSHLSMQPIAKIVISGSILFTQKDYLISNCPYKKELVKNVNTAFPYVYVSIINNVQVGYLLTGGTRLVKQVLNDIAKSKKGPYIKNPLPVIIYGYELELPVIKEVFNNVTPVYVEKIIVNGRVYE